MSERPAIVLKGVGKRYTLFPSRVDALLDALGMTWLAPFRRKRYQTFWALRNIDLTLPKGARVGIVGRNGAGKSTLLKLITSNIEPTEGTVSVNGEVQALLQTGSGMHPDFTGYENIQAALTYQGLTSAEIKDAIADIEDFTELGPFLSQPFKAYSTGMQARLAFATATKVKPDILIIDEVLGVGDGYFLAKSTERIQKLIDSGASVLLVSHSMDQIVRFCDQALWIDRGQLVAQGDVLDVVKEYERYLRLLDERRIKGRNRSAQAGGAVPDGEQFTDSLVVRLTAPPGVQLRVAAISLDENDRLQETVRIGGPQDGAAGNSAGVILDSTSSWSEPVVAGQPFRRLVGGDSAASGEVIFRLYHFDPSVKYRFDIVCQAEGGAGHIEIRRQNEVLANTVIEPTSDWKQVRIENGSSDAVAKPEESANVVRLHHFSGLGGLEIERVRILGPDGEEQAVFPFGGTMVVEVTILARKDGAYPFCPVLVIYRRSDGIRVSQQVGEPTTLNMREGERRTARLQLEKLNLGNDTYVFAIGIFRNLDLAMVEAPERYELTERSFEFRIYGREPFYGSIFQHPGKWEILAAGVDTCRVPRIA